ncbi:MAG TPA: class I SAM-dependent methyltransferase [Gemmatimonadota bacterium]|nr:class I SAM-dependent methyltransferase [Gemmatimonadota bacterium]
MSAGGPPAELEPTRRFSDRVEDYVRSRPDYPAAAIDFVVEEAALPPGATVVDVGSGTGLLARPFLERGFRVVGVEPNGPMRAAGAQELAGFPRFRSVGGRAEATGLAEGIADLVTAGQAFHWFDPEAARREFARILRPGGGIALVWNERRTRGTSFLEGYEALLERHCPEYDAVRRRYARPEDLRTIFGAGGWREGRFDHEQSFGWEGLARRVLSSSYTPREGDPGRARLLSDLRALFDAGAGGGRVRFPYDTRVYVGGPARDG